MRKLGYFKTFMSNIKLPRPPRPSVSTWAMSEMITTQNHTGGAPTQGYSWTPPPIDNGEKLIMREGEIVLTEKGFTHLPEDRLGPCGRICKTFIDSEPYCTSCKKGIPIDEKLIVAGALHEIEVFTKVPSSEEEFRKSQQELKKRQKEVQQELAEINNQIHPQLDSLTDNAKAQIQYDYTASMGDLLRRTYRDGIAASYPKEEGDKGPV